MVLDEEVHCANAIKNASAGTRITWAYDTTTRKGIKGEWVSSNVHFNNGKKYRMRPILMAKENRNNIAQYFIEQLKRLAVAGNTSTIVIWNKISALVTDSAAKNLKIIPLIIEILHNTHSYDPNLTINEPLHLLCIIHTLECFDKKMLEQLKKVRLIIIIIIFLNMEVFRLFVKRYLLCETIWFFK